MHESGCVSVGGMKKSFKTVDAYIAGQPEDLRRALAKIRAAIRKAVPEAVELISYQMPSYKLHGRALMYFAGWAEHYAIYPGSATVVAELADDLKPYKLSKGTIRFERDCEVPVALVKRIAVLRAREVEAAQAAKKKQR